MSNNRLPLWAKTCLTGIGALACHALFAADLPTIADAEIQACIDRAMPEKSSAQTITLRSFDESGLISESVANTYWRREPEGKYRAVIRLTAPASRIGLAVLMVESDSLEPTMYLYVPDLKRTRRVTGKQLAASMMGTDFSYEEFAHFQKTASESTTKRVDDQQSDGAAAYVLETTPAGDTSAYGRILTYIDQAQCVPVKTQFFNVNGELGKELIAERAEIKEIGNRFVPHRIVMYDREKNTRTELIVQDVEIDVKLSDGLFSPKRLGMAR